MIAPFLVGVLLSAASYAGTSDVADAAMNRDLAAVRALLAKKADVNAPQADGTTALHWAVHHEDVALVDELLARGRERHDRQSRGGDAVLSGVDRRQPRDHGQAAEAGGRRQRHGAAARRNAADVCRAHRPSRGGEAAARSRRQGRREGDVARDDGIDVGRRAGACGGRSSCSSRAAPTSMPTRRSTQAKGGATACQQLHGRAPVTRAA